MAYKRKIYRSENYIETEISHLGRYGAKGERRAERQKATPEQVKKQNQWLREKQLRRVLQLNFYPNDIWLTLKYPKGTRKTVPEVEKDIRKFQDKMRKEYKKRGEDFKWVKRIEIGKKGGIHAHFVINRIWGSELLVSKCWPHTSHYESITERGGMEDLAAYIVKPLPEEVEQLSMFEDERKRVLKYSTSRNLIRPEPEVKVFKRKTVRKYLEELPVTPGFYIDKESVRIGVNQITGYSYIHYRQIRIEPVKRVLKPPGGGNASKDFFT